MITRRRVLRKASRQERAGGTALREPIQIERRNPAGLLVIATETM